MGLSLTLDIVSISSESRSLELNKGNFSTISIENLPSESNIYTKHKYLETY